MNLYENDFFSLKSKNNDVYILVKNVGYDIRKFHEIIKDNIRINIDSFLSLKRALSEASKDEVKIGILKDEIEIFISSDYMVCEMKVNLSQDYIDLNLGEIHGKILFLLRSNNITIGIETQVLSSHIITNEKFIIAKGKPASQGEDSVIKYFTRSDRKIEIKKDGKADYYNLNLIDSVKKGEWLGEKTFATLGENGFNIKGEILPATTGTDEPLLYDENSIRLCEENGKLVLRALSDGAVSFENNKICVQSHLIIEGDVDFSTGNINFDGHVTIKGTIKDGFNVSALNDISILGEMGVGTAGKISSRRGSLFIKGGVNGKGITDIYADQNVYTKYANEVSITAGREINIGYYAIGCDLYGDKILINGMNGRLISGSVYAKSQVIVGVIGNVTERETNINVHGFNRFELRKEYEDILIRYKELLIGSERLKSDLNLYRKSMKTNSINEEKYYEKLNEYESILADISYLNKKRIKIQDILNSRGEGEVSVMTGMHPQTFLELKNMKRNINEFTKGTFYVENKEIHFKEN